MTEFELRVGESLCEDLALTWQSSQIDRLNGLLKKHGVKDAARREILESFFFDLACDFDGSSTGVRFKDKDYRPRLIFETPDNPPGLLISDKYDLHDNTHCDIAGLFEEEGG